MAGLVLSCLADNDSAQQPKRFAVEGGYIDIYEEFGDEIDHSVYSNVLWDGALLVSGLLRRQPWLVRGRRVLELGAGLGLPSLLAGALGAEVVASEQAPVELLRREVNRNSLFIRQCGGRTEVQEVDWEWPPSEVCARIGTFDLVLGCDILAGVRHGTNHYRQILGIAEAVVRPGGSAMFTWIPRCGIPYDRLLSCVSTELPGWDASVLDETLYDPAFFGEGFCIMHICRKGETFDLDGLD